MKTALITGAGKGIGQALANTFKAAGFEVIGTTRTGGDYPLDLSKPASIKTFAEKLTAKLKAEGRSIDVLINNAGVLADRGLTSLNIEKLRENLEVNLIGTADLTEKLVPLMIGNGQIIFITSAAGSLNDMDSIDHSHAPYKYPGYKISKSALNMYMRTLAARLTREGSKIIVSAIHPGWVRTEMGGDDAPITPEEAARDIFELATKEHPTGGFWFKGNRYPW